MESSNNLKIMAVGGKAPNGKAGSLLKEALMMAQPETHTNVLIIPTAKTTQTAHDISIDKASQLYTKTLGVPLRVLHGFNQMPDKNTIDEQIEWADAVYISGGDTKRMIDSWQIHGIDAKLKERALGGLVLSGISAGAIAPFAFGHSDWEHYYQDEWKYRLVAGLSLVDAAITPHADSITHEDIKRIEDFKYKFAHDTSIKSLIGLAIDNFAAVKISDGEIMSRSADSHAGVTIFDKRSGELTEEKLSDSNPTKLSELGL